MPGRKPYMSHIDEVNMIAKLADLKEEHYNHTLMISALTELLIEKGILSMSELQARVTLLDLLNFQDVVPEQGKVGKNV